MSVGKVLGFHANCVVARERRQQYVNLFGGLIPRQFSSAFSELCARYSPRVCLWKCVPLFFHCMHRDPLLRLCLFPPSPSPLVGRHEPKPNSFGKLGKRSVLSFQKLQPLSPSLSPSGVCFAGLMSIVNSILDFESPVLLQKRVSHS